MRSEIAEIRSDVLRIHYTTTYKADLNNLSTRYPYVPTALKVSYAFKVLDMLGFVTRTFGGKFFRSTSFIRRNVRILTLLHVAVSNLPTEQSGQKLSDINRGGSPGSQSGAKSCQSSSRHLGEGRREGGSWGGKEKGAVEEEKKSFSWKERSRKRK